MAVTPFCGAAARAASVQSFGRNECARIPTKDSLHSIEEERRWRLSRPPEGVAGFPSAEGGSKTACQNENDGCARDRRRVAKTERTDGCPKTGTGHERTEVKS